MKILRQFLLSLAVAVGGLVALPIAAPNAASQAHAAYYRYVRYWPLVYVYQWVPGAGWVLVNTYYDSSPFPF